MACRVKGCKKSNAAHAREYDYIEETIGRRAAEEYEREHSDPADDDDNLDDRPGCKG